MNLRSNSGCRRIWFVEAVGIHLAILVVPFALGADSLVGGALSAGKSSNGVG